MEQNQTKITPKDTFLHLLSIFALYASAISFSVLLFNYIDYWFPDVARDAYYYREGLTGAMRFAVSTLIVVFPVFFGVRRYFRKSYQEEPARRNMILGRWLEYFTLFLAAIIGIGWLIATINRFLEGDFTTAFLLKALTIFFVTGSIFYYYLSEIRGEWNKPLVRYYSYVASILVVIAIFGAFFAVGSPEARRLRKADMQRIYDLQSIQSRIGEFYQIKSKLPEKLADLNDAMRGVNIPKDPATGEEYVYDPKDPLSFALCADFSLAWSPDAENGKQDTTMPFYPEMYYGQSGLDWKHDTGRQCFERTIDPDFFQNVPIKR